MQTMESNTERRNSGDEQQPWQNLMGLNMGMVNEGYTENYYNSSTTAHLFNQDYVDEQQHALSVFPYPNFPPPEIEIPNNGFIDAWSIDNNSNLNSSGNNGSVESSISLNEGDLSPSLNLSMTMAAGKNVLDEDLQTSQMGISSNFRDFEGQRNKDSLWLSPVSWELFARGGPLGEALQPGTAVGAVGASSPPSPIGTPATTVSSPSGVLHRTLFSHSDGSVCNSPTLVAAPPSEVSIQWLN